MDRLVITNIAIYKAIADEAHQKMVQLMEAGRRPKPDGSAGWIITYDPNQTSFKQSMISIVFTGMWLEALMHLLVVKKYGKDKFKEYDFEPYEKKLQLLGCTDKKLLDRVSRFRKTRKSLVHEKAHFDFGEIKKAQDEAENAHEMLVAIHKHFSEQLG
ncbi:MAG: hypothetical protein ACFFCW_47110 [Candidatus Hodarchaeota archaeon]